MLEEDTLDPVSDDEQTNDTQTTVPPDADLPPALEPSTTPDGSATWQFMAMVTSIFLMLSLLTVGTFIFLTSRSDAASPSDNLYTTLVAARQIAVDNGGAYPSDIARLTDVALYQFSVTPNSPDSIYDVAVRRALDGTLTIAVRVDSETCLAIRDDLVHTSDPTEVDCETLTPAFPA